jgi:hypothetical protein
MSFIYVSDGEGPFYVPSDDEADAAAAAAPRPGSKTRGAAPTPFVRGGQLDGAGACAPAPRRAAAPALAPAAAAGGGGGGHGGASATQSVTPFMRRMLVSRRSRLHRESAAPASRRRSAHPPPPSRLAPRAPCPSLPRPPSPRQGLARRPQRIEVMAKCLVDVVMTGATTAQWGHNGGRTTNVQAKLKNAGKPRAEKDAKDYVGFARASLLAAQADAGKPRTEKDAKDYSGAAGASLLAAQADAGKLRAEKDAKDYPGAAGASLLAAQQNQDVPLEKRNAGALSGATAAHMLSAQGRLKDMSYMLFFIDGEGGWRSNDDMFSALVSFGFDTYNALTLMETAVQQEPTYTRFHKKGASAWSFVVAKKSERPAAPPSLSSSSSSSFPSARASAPVSAAPRASAPRAPPPPAQRGITVIGNDDDDDDDDDDADADAPAPAEASAPTPSASSSSSSAAPPLPLLPQSREAQCAANESKTPDAIYAREWRKQQPTHPCPRPGCKRGPSNPFNAKRNLKEHAASHAAGTITAKGDQVNKGGKVGAKRKRGDDGDDGE